MHTLKKALLPVMLAAAFVGCSNDNNTYEDTDAFKNKDDRNVQGAAVVRFSPANSELPFPTDILFSGTPDGSLNIPGTATNGSVSAPTKAQAADPQVALNTMDGFSTTSPASFTITGEIDSSTLNANVRVFKTDTDAEFSALACLFAGSCTGFDAGSKTTWSLEDVTPAAGADDPASRELVNGEDFVVSGSPNGQGGTTVAILPLRPMVASSTYVVAVGSGIELAAQDKTVGPDTEYRLLKRAEPLFYLSRDVASDIDPTALTQISMGISSQLGAAGITKTPAEVEGALKANLGVGTNPSPDADNNSCVIAQQIVGVLAQQTKGTPLEPAIASLNFNPASDCTAAVSLLDTTEKAVSFESLRLQTSTQEAAISDFSSISAENIVASFSFSTQNVGTALLQAKGIVSSTIATAVGTELAQQPTPSAPVFSNMTNLGATPLPPQSKIDVDGPGPQAPEHLVDVHVGVFNNVPQFVDPSAPLSSVWQGDPAAWADAAALGGNAAAATACENAFGANTESQNLVQCNGYKPAVAGSSDIPVIVTVPNAYIQGVNPSCTEPFKTVIYQHGITSNRATLLAMANTLGSQCIVGVAVDLPLHGIDDQDNFAGLQGVAGGTERLLDSANAESGSEIINLTHLANARDLLRQGVTDIHSLYAAVATSVISQGSVPQGGLNIPGKLTAGGGVIDETDISFVGISLGGILGMPFTAHNAQVGEAVFNVAGGGISKLLDGSPEFEPSITEALAANGIAKPSSDYESFMVATQTVLDNVDPINFTALVTNPIDGPSTPPLATNRPILFQEVLGDQVVPNNVFGADLGVAFAAIHGTSQTGFLEGQNPVTVPSPLAGTDPLVLGTDFVQMAATAQAGGTPTPGLGFTGLGLSKVPAAGTTGANLNSLVRFQSGGHSSLLNPLIDPDVTTVMQSQVAAFVANDGTVVVGEGNAAAGTGGISGVIFD